MDIKLYHNNSLSNVVDKSLTLVSTSTSAKFLEPYDEYAPVIRYRGKTNFDDVNYISVEQAGTGGFTRYYFLENVTYKSPNIAILKCRLDVLKTYKTFIEGLTCYIERTDDATFKNPYMVDDNHPLYPMKNVERITFRDANDNVEGFVIPGESQADQKANGFYLMSVMTAGFGPYEHGNP